MRVVKKILKWTGGTLLSLILLLVLLGYLFEDKIHMMAIRELGRQLNADITVEDTEVSFLRGFPYVYVELQGVTVNPKDSDNPEDLLHANSISCWVNLWSVLGGDEYEITGIRLDEPDLRLIHLADDSWTSQGLFENEEEAEAESDSEVKYNLTDLRVRGGRYTYRDPETGTDILLDSIDIDLSGDFSAASTLMDTELAFMLRRCQNGGASWAPDKYVKADLSLDAAFGEDARYALREGSVEIASLALDLEGEVRSEGPDYAVDLRYKTNKNDFSSFMSLLPGDFLGIGRSYEYDGIFNLTGYVKGLVGEEHTPTVAASYEVRDGSFRYTDFPGRLSDVWLKGDFHIAEDEPGHVVAENFSARLNNRNVKGRFSYRNFNDPELDMALQGLIGLKDIQEFYPAIAARSTLSGLIDCDIEARGRISDFREQHYKDVYVAGHLDLQGLNIEDPAVPKRIRDLGGRLVVNNDKIVVKQLNGAAGRSDFLIEGEVTQYLPYLFDSTGLMTAGLSLKSSRLDLNEWLSESPSVLEGEPDESSVYALRLPERVNVQLRADVSEFSLGNFKAAHIDGSCRLHSEGVEMHGMNLQALDGAVSLRGNVRIENEQRARINVDAQLNDVDINETFKTFNQWAAFALVEENLYGRFSGNMHIEGLLNEHLELEPSSLLSYGDVTLREGRLVNFEPLEAMAGFVKIEKLRDVRFSDVETSYRIEKEQFIIPRLKLRANEYNMEVEGQHGFDNSLNYLVAVELPHKDARQSKSAEVLQYVQEAEAESGMRVVIPIRITGTVDNPKFSLDRKEVMHNVVTEIKKQGEEIKVAKERAVEETFGVQDTSTVDDWVIEQPRDNTTNPLEALKKIKIPFGKKKKKK